MMNKFMFNQNVNIEKNFTLVGGVLTDCLNKSMNSYEI